MPCGWLDLRPGGSRALLVDSACTVRRGFTHLMRDTMLHPLVGSSRRPRELVGRGGGRFRVGLAESGMHGGDPGSDLPQMHGLVTWTPTAR